MTNEKLVAAYQKGDTAALGELIEQNKKLVFYVMKKFFYIPENAEDREDFYQEGCIGLIQAADKFDTTKDAKFSTYATFWIRQAIERYSDRNRAVRIPAHLSEAAIKVRRVEREIERKNEKCSSEQIAERCGISVEKYLFIKKATQEALSLDAPVKCVEDGDITLGDTLVADCDTEKDAVDNFFSENLHKELKKRLTDKEYDVICRRYGMNGYAPMTLGQIGLQYGVTRERIRQIELRAVRKIRNKYKRHIPDGFVV